MSETPEQSTVAESPTGAASKRPWHLPTVQEIDVVETQAGAGAYTPNDLQTYAS